MIVCINSGLNPYWWLFNYLVVKLFIKIFTAYFNMYYDIFYVNSIKIVSFYIKSSAQ